MWAETHLHEMEAFIAPFTPAGSRHGAALAHSFAFFACDFLGHLKVLLLRKGERGCGRITTNVVAKNLLSLGQ